jgi:hypothetical protein
MSYSNKIYELLGTNKSLPIEDKIFEFGENDYEYWYVNHKNEKVSCSEITIEHLHQQWLFCKSAKLETSNSPTKGEISKFSTGFNDPLSL